jgi:hypothetical protein
MREPWQQYPLLSFKIKTIKAWQYRQAFISDEQVMLWRCQTFAEAIAAGRVKPGTREWDGVAPNGIEFHGYVDVKTGVVTSFFPKVSEP